MLVLITIMIILAWLLMMVLVIFAPFESKDDEKKQMILHAGACGPGFEIEFRRTLHGLPPETRLIVVDDMSDLVRSQVIERLLLKNPGVVLERSEAEEQLG